MQACKTGLALRTNKKEPNQTFAELRCELSPGFTSSTTLIVDFWRPCDRFRSTLIHSVVFTTIAVFQLSLAPSYSLRPGSTYLLCPGSPTWGCCRSQTRRCRKPARPRGVRMVACGGCSSTRRWNRCKKCRLREKDQLRGPGQSEALLTLALCLRLVHSLASMSSLMSIAAGQGSMNTVQCLFDKFPSSGC